MGGGGGSLHIESPTGQPEDPAPLAFIGIASLQPEGLTDAPDALYLSG
jgi:hypothetical protein